MALSSKELKIVNEIAVRAAKEPAFRTKLRKDLAGVLKAYKLSASAAEVRKALPKGLLSDELSDEDLAKVAAGNFIGGIVSSLGHDFEHAGIDAFDAAKDVGKAFVKPIEDVGKGVYDAGKDVVEGGVTATKDLFSGNVGGAAKALVNVPVAVSKDALSSVTSSAKDFANYSLDAAAKVMDTGIDISPVSLAMGAVGLGGAASKLDGFLKNMSNQTANGFGDAVGFLANITRDQGDGMIDATNMAFTAGAQMFDDATHGKWGQVLKDPLTVPLAAVAKDGKQALSDTFNMKTLQGVISVAGVAVGAWVGPMLSGALSSAFTAVSTTVDGALGGSLSSAAGSISDAAAGLVSKAGSLFGSGADLIPGDVGAALSSTATGATATSATTSAEAAAAASNAGNGVGSILEHPGYSAAADAIFGDSANAAAAPAASEALQTGVPESVESVVSKLSVPGAEMAAETGIFTGAEGESASADAVAKVGAESGAGAAAADAPVAAAAAKSPFMNFLSRNLASMGFRSLAESAAAGGESALAGAPANVATNAASSLGARSFSWGLSGSPQYIFSQLGTRGTLLLAGGGLLASGGALLPLLFRGKGSSAAGATATMATTTPSGAASSNTQGLSTMVQVLQDPQMAALATAIDQQSGNSNMSQNVQTLLQNAQGVLQNPTADNVAQIQQQLAQIYQSIQPAQGQAPSAETQQMEQVLTALYQATSASSAADASSAGAPASPAQGLSAALQVLQAPQMGQLASAIDQQAGNTSMSQGIQTLSQNAQAVMQNPTADNTSQLQNQIVQLAQTMQPAQGQAPSQEAQQMLQVLQAIYQVVGQSQTGATTT